MALVPCKECNAEISEKAKVCPKCGQEDPIAKKIKCSECENMVVLSTEGACPICGNPEVLAEKKTLEIPIPQSSSISHHVEIQEVAEIQAPKVDYGVFLLCIPIAAIVLMWVWVWFGGIKFGLWEQHPITSKMQFLNFTLVFIAVIYFATMIGIGVTIDREVEQLDHTIKEPDFFIKLLRNSNTFVLLVVGGAIVGGIGGSILGKIIGIRTIEVELMLFSGYLYYYYKRIVFKLPNLFVIGVIIVLTFTYSAKYLIDKAKEYNSMVEQQKSLEKK